MGGVLPPWQPPWADTMELAATALWPRIPSSDVVCARRGSAAEHEAPFLTRLVDHLPRTADTWECEQYLALVDRALLDRVVSVREREALARASVEWGIDRPTALRLHRAYLDALAHAAAEDGVVAEDEIADLCAVARLLGLSGADVDRALTSATDPVAPEAGGEFIAPATFRLRLGDLVVFTGDMAEPRDTWVGRASRAGLVAHPNVTKRVALVVAADPDSLSGKARKAAAYGIPIVTEHAFAGMLDALLTAPVA